MSMDSNLQRRKILKNKHYCIILTRTLRLTNVTTSRKIKIKLFKSNQELEVDIAFVGPFCYKTISTKNIMLHLRFIKNTC